MCGRIRQAREPADYLESLNWNPHDLGKLADGLKYNVPPDTSPLVMHQLGDRSDQVDSCSGAASQSGTDARQ